MQLRKKLFSQFVKNPCFIRRFCNSSNLCLNKNQSENFKHESKGATVSHEEMKQFQQFVGEWWRPGGPYDSLRAMNELRVPLIKNLCMQHGALQGMTQPLTDIDILDVGSGGGILAEPLSRLGANVLGIDPLEENIEAARQHAAYDPDLSTLTYECTDIETISSEQPEKFDVVVASEVLEHVNNPELFIQSCCDAIKPGGHIVITTINRNLVSISLAKYMAEYILRIVPENTHDENKFITPFEVTTLLRKAANVVDINFKGMMLNPLTNHWSWSNVDLINYACTARKDSH